MTERLRWTALSLIAWPLGGTLVIFSDAASRGLPLASAVWGWVGWLEWGVLAPLIILLTTRVPYGHRAFFAVHAVAPFVFSAAHSLIYFSLQIAFRGYAGDRGESLGEAWFARLQLHLTLDLLVYSATVLSTHITLYLRAESSRQQQAHALERDIARAELDVLRMQLQPDLVASKLEEIESHIDGDVREAERSITTFARYLRTSIALSRSRERDSAPRAQGEALLRSLAPLIVVFTIAAVAAILTAGVTGSRTIDFLVIFAIALAALAYRRYAAYLARNVELARLDAQLVRTQAHLLRLQLNPHFLFNALNSIAALLEDDVRGAKQMAAQLRGFLKRVLETSDRAEVPLDTELDLLANYVAIEQVRFSDRLHFDVRIDEQAKRALVPSLLLQPLVENAIRHGLRPAGGGQVRVSAAVERDELRVEVADDGRGAGAPLSEGIGLTNTRARLRQLYGDTFGFDAAGANDGFRATLRIPLRYGLVTT